MFQSTHPRGVRPFAGGAAVLFEKFQSTHPRGVRLGRDELYGSSLSVSIHAPAWGATLKRLE